MKQTITILIFFFSFFKTYGQSSTVGIIPETMSIVLCTDNLNLTTEYSPFGLYSIWEADKLISSSDYRYGFPSTLGVNVAFFQNSFNVGGGATIEWLLNDEYEIYPNVMLRFHPLKMLTQKNRTPDVSLMLNISKQTNFGIGLSIPFRLNAL
jgi:hypothetical protein